jgi:chorismate dehydratase
MSTMEALRISAVSYLNTFPFVYGLKKSGILKNFSLSLDVPSVCAAKLTSGHADLALVPAGALPEIGDYHIQSPYCIGAVGEVRTVLLLSHEPLARIREVNLDYDSRTSVALVKVLARHYWKIAPRWKNLSSGEAEGMRQFESVTAIGDKTFGMREKYPYVYDLAREWHDFTRLPFVFALWISRNPLPERIGQDFAEALGYGVRRKPESIEYFREKLPPGIDCQKYLEKNISFELDADKRRGLKLFLDYLRQTP